VSSALLRAWRIVLTLGDEIGGGEKKSAEIIFMDLALSAPLALTLNAENSCQVKLEC
jgi:hypothetical protein